MKQILIVIAIIAVIIIITNRARAAQQFSEIERGTDSTGTPKPTGSGTSVPSWKRKYDALPELGDDALLKKGVKSKEVWNLQYLYNTKVSPREGKSKIAVDGIFGSQTETAVKYVLNGKYNYTRLANWRKWVSMTKQQRINYMNDKANAGENAIAAAAGLGENIGVEWSTPYY